MYEQVTKTKNEIEFYDKCIRTFTILSKVVPKSQLALAILHDMLEQSGKSRYTLYSVMNYKGDEEFSLQRPDDCLLVTNCNFSFSRIKASQHSFLTVEECKSKMSSNLSNSTEDERTSQSKGFRPNVNLRWSSSDDSFDIKVDDAAIEKVIPLRQLFTVSMLELQENQSKVREVLSKFALSDEARKNLWRRRIGNRLRITQQLYQSLLDKLAVESISKKAEKVIVDDLDRTWPHCNDIEEGRVMYAEMKQVLSLIEVGRE